MANLIETIPPAPLRRAQPTLYDVCRISGASSATVSRVFSGKARVSDQIRKRVVDAAQELGYEPSHAARALAGKRTHTLGAIFPEIASGFYADVLAGIDEVAAESGFEVLAWGIFWRIILPLSRPALKVVALFAFLAIWNEFLGPLIYLQRPEQFTLALGLQNFQSKAGGTSWHLLMAASTLVVLPAILLFFLAQKTFIEGIATTGTKG